MKKSILLTLCCLFIFIFQALSQDFKVIWGNGDEKTKKMIPMKIVCKDSTGFYVLLRDDFSIIRQLAKYDLNMNFKWVIPLEVKISKNKNAKYLDVFSFNNKILLLVFDYDKAASTRKIFALNISPSGIIDPAYREICSIKAPDLYRLYYFSDINHSETQMRFETYFENDQKDQIKLSFEFNKDLEIIEKSKLQDDSLKLEFAEIKNLNLSSTDSNYYYFMPSKIKVENEIEKKILVVQNKYTKAVKKVELDIGNYNVAGLVLNVDTINKYFNVSGIYEDIEGTLIGTFLLKIDLLTIKIVSTDMKPFNDDLVNTVKNVNVLQSNNQQVEKKNISLKGYNIKEVLFNDYEDVYYIYEQNAHATENSSYGGMYYFSKNAFVICFDKIGNFKWAAFVPKYQENSNYSLISFGSFVYNNELYIMYNDNPKNLTMDPINVYIAQGQSTFSLVTIKFDKNGKMEKKSILPVTNKTQSICVESQTLELFGDDVIVIAKEVGNYKIGKITLK